MAYVRCGSGGVTSFTIPKLRVRLPSYSGSMPLEDNLIVNTEHSSTLTIGDISGIGDLTIYGDSTRIGTWSSDSSGTIRTFPATLNLSCDVVKIELAPYPGNTITMEDLTFA